MAADVVRGADAASGADREADKAADAVKAGEADRESVPAEIVSAPDAAPR